MLGYLWWCQLLNRVAPAIDLGGLTITVSPSTYKPLHGEIGLARHCRAGDRVLDLGTGSGVIALAAARQGATVVGSDISPVAVRDARRNAERNGLGETVRFVESDCYDAVDERFDVIVSHLPYVELALGTGHDGQWAATDASVAERVVIGAAQHLTERGRLVLLWPRGKRARVESLAGRAGLHLVQTEPWHPGSLKLAALRWLYFDVGFELTVYVLAADGPAAEPAGS